MWDELIKDDGLQRRSSLAEGYKRFEGNCPKSVSRDAKYAIRSIGSRTVVAVTYRTSVGEEWLASTTEHPELVKIVNSIKTGVGSALNGPFYINEHSQVIVPVGDQAEYYVADDIYGLPLQFKFEGNILSGQGVDLSGRPIEPGDLWMGPHPGIPYVLRAGADDIYYDSSPRPFVKRRSLLSDHVGGTSAAKMAKRVSGVKGWQGGRFYINEWQEMFAPVSEQMNLEYRYIGHLEENDPWFPCP
jgi:hypothetical protein